MLRYKNRCLGCTSRTVRNLLNQFQPVKSSSSSSCSVIRCRWSPSLAEREAAVSLTSLVFFILSGDLALLGAPMKWAKSSVCCSKNSNRLPRPPSGTFDGVGTSAGVATDEDEVDSFELEAGLAITWNCRENFWKISKTLKNHLNLFWKKVEPDWSWSVDAFVYS